MEQVYNLLGVVLGKDPKSIIAYPKGEPLERLGMDSLGMIRFIVLLEEEFDIAFLNSDLVLANFVTLEALEKTLEKYALPEK